MFLSFFLHVGLSCLYRDRDLQLKQSPILHTDTIAVEEQEAKEFFERFRRLSSNHIVESGL